LVEPPVPLNDLALCTAEAAAVENLPTADTHMAGDDLLPFTLAERSNFFPRNLPPSGSFHGSQLPVRSILNSQPALRMANPPEMLGRRFFFVFLT